MPENVEQESWRYRDVILLTDAEYIIENNVGIEEILIKIGNKS